MQVPSPESVSVLFLDLQEEIIKNSHTLEPERLQRSSNILAKLAALHNLPTFLSAVGPGGPFSPSVLEPLDPVTPRLRTHTTAFADVGMVAELRATGRSVLILAGVASEIVVLRTALDALAMGFQVHVAVDACGGVSQRTEEAAWRRLVSAGGTTTSVATVAAELAGDFSTELGGATLALLYESLRA